MIKLIISSLLFAPLLLTATEKSLNEETVITHLHYLYKSVKIKGDTVHVKGPMLSKRVPVNEESSERFSFKKRKFTISLDEFNFEKALAQNTFTAISNDGTGRGTAVYIGGNFILTNFHVYNREYEMTACKTFKVKLNPDLGSKSFACKKAIKCNKELDYCLVEMKGDLAKYTHAPNLKLEIEENQIVRLLGNVGSKGLQASKARGLVLKGKRYLHQAPLFKGASGGPLFNDSGELIGINFAETKILRGSKAYNFATPLKFIKEDLEQDTDPSIMGQIAL
ncbi:MAG: hypothetical protein CME70_01090 [Halobacteriovorax sp.]|nr:hypothetical protein [Halobacteriovorax sp.]|tara:strand:- start:87134 stop:87973 length:840 start_codon:yes stop_codon:yes gene_type:complete